MRRVEEIEGRDFREGADVEHAREAISSAMRKVKDLVERYVTR